MSKNIQTLKEKAIKDIRDSGAVYVKTSISTEACAIEIAIRDIQDIDLFPEDFYFEACSTGLDEEDY